MHHDYVFCLADSADRNFINLTQLKHEPITHMNQEVVDHLEAYLDDKVIIARQVPAGYKAIQAAVCCLEKLEDKNLYAVFQAEGQRPTILPRAYVNLTDVQFRDASTDVSVVRSIIGIPFDLTEPIGTTDLDFTQAFQVHEHAFIFPLEMRLSKGQVGTMRKPVVEGYAEAIGYTTLQDLLDDVESFDELSVTYAQAQLAQNT